MNGKVALITGASSGVGKAIARQLAEEGMHVCICGRREQPLSELAEQIQAQGGKAYFEAFDIRDSELLAGFVERAHAHFGRLDVLVNNAGLGHGAPIVESSIEQWREMLDVNLLAVLVATQASVRAMRQQGEGGHVINISSTATKRRDGGVYGGTKHALNVIADTLREELVEDQIRVTSVMPGYVSTNFIRNIPESVLLATWKEIGLDALSPLADGTYSDDDLALMAEKMRGRICQPEDVARTVSWVLKQPVSMNLDDVVVRPVKPLFP